MPDLDRARAYLAQNGSPLERAAALAIFTGTPMPPEMVAEFLSGQQTDGGFAPFWAQRASSIDATCYRLTQARQIGLLARGLPALNRAITFLLQRQAEDGHWAEDAALAELAPHWATPGDLAATLYITAQGGLAVAPFAPEAARKAMIFLAQHTSPEGLAPSFAQTQWLAGALAAVLGDPLARRYLAPLEANIPTLSPGSLTWLLNTLLDAGIPPTDALVVVAAQRLAGLQEADGHWSSDDGPACDAQTTLEAARALRLLGG